MDEAPITGEQVYVSKNADGAIVIDRSLPTAGFTATFHPGLLGLDSEVGWINLGTHYVELTATRTSPDGPLNTAAMCSRRRRTTRRR